MDFFKRYSSIGGGGQQTASETIQRLADRVETSTLLEDKRAAVLGLKGLSREYKEEVGEASLTALLKVLKEDSEDQNLVKAILETLTNLCTHDTTREYLDSDNMNAASDAASDRFAQDILDDKDSIANLLELLVDADFYVRFYTVQLIGALHKFSGEQVQRLVLVSPTGVGRLVDLLSDQRDIIRNEGIQLLIAMTESNADIQKIVAFENAFDHLLGIVNEEGGVRGNIVVQDCLQLLHNLLNYNISNQNFFRETSGIQRLPDLLITDPNEIAGEKGNGAFADVGDDDFEWTAQHARNMLVVLDVIRMLIQPGNTNTESNQTAMQQCGIIPPLLQLALTIEAPSSVRSQALYAIGDIIRSNSPNQNLFQRILITAASFDDDSANQEKAIPEPAVVIVIRLAVGLGPESVPLNEYYIVRSAAAYLVQAYIGGNPDAQLALAATLTPPGDASTLSEPDNHQSAGSMIVSVLLDWQETGRNDVWRVWFGSLLLSSILHGYDQCKQQALKITLGDEAKGEDPIPLINEIASQARHAVKEGSDIRICIAFLSLMCIWVADSPETVSVFLDESSTTSFLVEQIVGSSGINNLVQGMSAFLFGLVYQFDTQDTTPVSRQDLYPIISKRIGTDQLMICVQRLRDSKEFQYAMGLSAGTHSSAYGGIPNEVYFDNVFTDMFKSHYELFRTAVRMSPDASPATANMTYLQGGMTAFPGSSTSSNAPGTPDINHNTQRSLSPAYQPQAKDERVSSEYRGEPTVPKSDFDSLQEKVSEQENMINQLRTQLKEAVAQAEADKAKSAEEAAAASEANSKELENAKEDIVALRAQLEETQSKIQSNENVQDDAAEQNVRVSDLEKELENLSLENKRKETEYEDKIEELQKKLSNAEKQVVKAAAAVRNTNKKKEKQQQAVIEAMEKDIKDKDAKIVELEEKIKSFDEKLGELEKVDSLKTKVADLEKEQEDLLVYLADQDQQAKEYRKKLRGYGEDIPASDDEDSDDEDDED